jgi:hypothetical protein
MQSVVKLSVIMPNIVKLSVIMLNVIALFKTYVVNISWHGYTTKKVRRYLFSCQSHLL